MTISRSKQNDAKRLHRYGETLGLHLEKTVGSLGVPLGEEQIRIVLREDMRRAVPVSEDYDRFLKPLQRDGCVPPFGGPGAGPDSGLGVQQRERALQQQKEHDGEDRRNHKEGEAPTPPTPPTPE